MFWSVSFALQDHCLRRRVLPGPSPWVHLWVQQRDGVRLRDRALPQGGERSVSKQTQTHTQKVEFTSTWRSNKCKTPNVYPYSHHHTLLTGLWSLTWICSLNINVYTWVWGQQLGSVNFQSVGVQGICIYFIKFELGQGEKTLGWLCVGQKGKLMITSCMCLLLPLLP